MPDLKISQLPAATTPLTGTELVPLVQSGGNVKATTKDIANLGSALSSITVTPTGTQTVAPLILVVPPQAVQTPVGFYPAEGKWMSTFFYYADLNTGITAVTFDDLTGLVTFPGVPATATTVSFPALKYVNSSFSVSSTVSSLSAPELLVSLGNISCSSNNVLTSLSLPKLRICAFLTLSNSSALVSFSAPLLEVMTNLTVSGTMTALTTINLSGVTTIPAGISITSTSPSLATVNMNALATTGTGWTISTNASGGYSFPAIQGIAVNATSGNVITLTNVTSFSLGSGLKRVGGTAGNISASSPLDQTSVDNILVRLAALDGTGGTTAFSSRTVTIAGAAAAPSATGAAAKATLIARGCTVTTN